MYSNSVSAWIPSHYSVHLLIKMFQNTMSCCSPIAWRLTSPQCVFTFIFLLYQPLPENAERWGGTDPFRQSHLSAALTSFFFFFVKMTCAVIFVCQRLIKLLQINNPPHANSLAFSQKKKKKRNSAKIKHFLYAIITAKLWKILEGLLYVSD